MEAEDIGTEWEPAPASGGGHRDRGRGFHRGAGHRHHGDFPPQWAGWEGFPGFPGRGWFGGPRGGRRARRGDVRSAILAVLAEKPLHGYDLIRELEERSHQMWHPSPGSVYPTLQMLEEQGLLTSVEQDGKRVYSITEAGRAELATRQERSGGTQPWDEAREGGERFGPLFGALSQLGAAAMQAARTGNPSQVDRVVQIVSEARKKVYAVLSED